MEINKIYLGDTLKDQLDTQQTKKADSGFNPLNTIVILPDLQLRIGRLTIDFNKNYGCDNSNGWSIAWEGHYLVQLKKYLFVAIYKAIRAI